MTSAPTAAVAMRLMLVKLTIALLPLDLCELDAHKVTRSVPIQIFGGKPPFLPAQRRSAAEICLPPVGKFR
jgi:hypothetical protein